MVEESVIDRDSMPNKWYWRVFYVMILFGIYLVAGAGIRGLPFFIFPLYVYMVGYSKKESDLPDRTTH